MLALESKVYSQTIAAESTLFAVAPAAVSAAVSPASAIDLSLERIQAVFMEAYQVEIAKFDPKKKDTIESHMIQRSVAGFTRCVSTPPGNNKTTFEIKFAINLSQEDKRKYKKYDEEIGFFNFNFTVYKKPDGAPFKISYFSEIRLDRKFQAYGLASVVINAYTKALQRLEANIDYLHVKSQGTNTAAMYKGKNYALTPSTLELIKTKYSGVERYLADSSVSYEESDFIEMYRAIDGRSVVTDSIIALEKSLKNS